MTNHRHDTAQSGHISWWPTGKVNPSLLIGGFALMGYLTLLGADGLQSARSAPKPAVAGSPAVGHAMDAAREERLAEENLIQTYPAWLQAAHAHAALYGQDAPLPSQF